MRFRASAAHSCRVTRDFAYLASQRFHPPVLAMMALYLCSSGRLTASAKRMRAPVAISTAAEPHKARSIRYRKKIIALTLVDHSSSGIESVRRKDDNERN